MSYTPTNWQTGDTITAEKINKLENGVADSGQYTEYDLSTISDEDAIASSIYGAALDPGNHNYSVVEKEGQEAVNAFNEMVGQLNLLKTPICIYTLFNNILLTAMPISCSTGSGGSSIVCKMVFQYTTGSTFLIDVTMIFSEYEDSVETTIDAIANIVS